MKTKIISLLIGGIVVFPNCVMAGQISIPHLDLQIEGGVSAGYFYSNSAYAPEQLDTTLNITGLSYKNNPDNLLLNDMFLELVTNNKGPLDSQVQVGFGNLKQLSIYDGNGNHALGTVYQPVVNNTNTNSSINTTVNQYTLDNQLAARDANRMKIYYAQLGISPIEDMTIDTGILATNLGYEVSPSYANWNATLGMVWTRQPTYYPGVRINYHVMDLTPYVEYNMDESLGGKSSWALGLKGHFDNYRYSAAYFNADGGRDVADLMVEADYGFIKAAVNLDYHMLDNTPSTSVDSTAFAIATYVIPSFQQFDFPIRFEYVTEGDSRIFGVGNAYTVTFSPSWNITKNSFIRAEVSYISSYEIVFNGLSDGLQYFQKTSFALHMGYFL